jgi:hypothetical protein
MIYFRVLMEILFRKCPSIKSFDQQKLNQLKELLLARVFNDTEECPLSLHKICENGQQNQTGEVGSYWKSNYVMFCMKRLCERLPSM